MSDNKREQSYRVNIVPDSMAYDALRKTLESTLGKTFDGSGNKSNNWHTQSPQPNEYYEIFNTHPGSNDHTPKR